MSNDIKITPEQEKLIPEWNEKWTKVILSTDPIDLEKCSDAIRRYHAACSYPGPEVILHAPSAMIGFVVSALSVAIYEKFGKDGRFGDCPNIAPMLLDAIRNLHPREAWEAGIKWVNQFVKENLQEFPGAKDYDVRSDAEGTKQRWPEWYNGGSEWAFHCCYMSFLRDVVGVEPNEPEKYAPYEEMCLHGGPRFDDTEFTIFCDRAAVRKVEKVPDGENYRLHCEDGPAMAYNDGYEFYVIHGVNVDKQIVMEPETQTIEQIENEKNEEVRRIRIERFGWERYMREGGAQVLDKRRNDRDAQDEVLYQMKSIKRFVCSDPSTGRRYALGVPDSVTTCQEAQEWMSNGLDRFCIHRS